MPPLLADFIYNRVCIPNLRKNVDTTLRMPPLLADFIYNRVCKPNLRKNVDTTRVMRHRC